MANGAAIRLVSFSGHELRGWTTGRFRAVAGTTTIYAVTAKERLLERGRGLSKDEAAGQARFSRSRSRLRMTVTGLQFRFECDASARPCTNETSACVPRQVCRPSRRQLPLLTEAGVIADADAWRS
jgi:hypothetical protein